MQNQFGLDQSLFGWRFQHVVHFQSWIAVLLGARAVRSSGSPLVTRRHQECSDQGARYRQDTDYYRYHDESDVRTRCSLSL